VADGQNKDWFILSNCMAGDYEIARMSAVTSVAMFYA
jgi:hypothetical protein